MGLRANRVCRGGRGVAWGLETEAPRTSRPTGWPEGRDLHLPVEALGRNSSGGTSSGAEGLLHDVDRRTAGTGYSLSTRLLKESRGILPATACGQTNDGFSPRVPKVASTKLRRDRDGQWPSRGVIAAS